MELAQVGGGTPTPALTPAPVLTPAPALAPVLTPALAHTPTPAPAPVRAASRNSLPPALPRQSAEHLTNLSSGRRDDGVQTLQDLKKVNL